MKQLNKRSVFYNAGILVISSVILQAVGFFYRIMLSRTVGAEGMAAYQLVMSVYLVMSAFVLSGITMSVSAFSAEYSALGEHRRTPCLMRSAVLLFLAIYAVTLACVMPFVGQIASVLLNEPRTRDALVLLFPYMLLTGLENIFKSYFYGVKKLVLPAVSEICEQLIRIAAVFILVRTFSPDREIGHSAAAVIGGMFISEIFSSIFLFTGYRLHMRRRNIFKTSHSSGILIPTVDEPCRTDSSASEPCRTDPLAAKPYIKPTVTEPCRDGMLPMLRRIIASSMPIALSGILNRAVSSLTTVLIPRRLTVSGMPAAEAMAVFGTMTGMTVPLLFLPSALIFPLTTILIPKLSEGSALHDTEMIRRKCGKALHITSIIALPAIAFLIFLGDELAFLIYKTPEAGRHMFGLAFGVLFSFYAIISGSLLNGLGYTKSSAMSVVLVGVLQLANVWFVVGTLRLGMLGYIVGEAVCELIGFIFNLCCLKKATGLKIIFDNWFLTPLLAALLSGFTASAVFARLRLCTFSPALALTAAGISAVLVCLAVLRIRGIHFVQYLKDTLCCRT